MVGYCVIKELVSSIVNGKNFKNLGMKDFKPVYSNEDAPWPKGTLEEDDEAMQKGFGHHAGFGDARKQKLGIGVQ